MLTLFKRSNGIYYILYEENGKRKWKSTGRTQHAAALRDLRAFETEQIEKLTPKEISLSDFVRDFLAHSQATSANGTLVVFTPVLKNFYRFIGERVISGITPHDVDRYKAFRLGEVSPVSVNIDLRMLRAAFYTAERWKLIRENPFKRVPMARIPE